MLQIQLDKNAAVTLSRQIYNHIQKAILSKQLSAGELLPSTRELAQNLMVSRNTVTEAYEMLKAEGYLSSSQGSRFRVKELYQSRLGEIPLLPAASRYAEQPFTQANIEPIRFDLRTGLPDTTYFPFSTWFSMLNHTTNNLINTDFLYGSGKGYRPLCDEIAKWLYRTRGILVKAEDVFITSGSTQGLHLAVRLLLSRFQGQQYYRSAVASRLPDFPCLFAKLPCFFTENPCHTAISETLRLSGIPQIHIPVDQNGILPSCLQGWLESMTSGTGTPGVCGLYLTPSHQFPTGSILSAERKLKLIQLAHERDFYIVEDDYDSEFRYKLPPAVPMYSLAPDKIIYLGTFSKLAYPSLRIGYALIPPALQKQWLLLRKYNDVQNPLLEQAMMTEFLKRRKMDGHLRRMRKIYGNRRDRLVKCLKENFGQQIWLSGDAAGLHLACYLPGPKLPANFHDLCQSSGIALSLCSDYLEPSISPSLRTDTTSTDFSSFESLSRDQLANTLLIGYGNLPDDAVGEATAALASLIKTLS